MTTVARREKAMDEAVAVLRAANAHARAVLSVFDEALAIPMPAARDYSKIALRPGLDRPRMLQSLEDELASLLAHAQVAEWERNDRAQAHRYLGERLRRAIDSQARDDIEPASARLEASEREAEGAKIELEMWEQLVREHELAISALRQAG